MKGATFLCVFALLQGCSAGDLRLQGPGSSVEFTSNNCKLTSTHCATAVGAEARLQHLEQALASVSAALVAQQQENSALRALISADAKDLADAQARLDRADASLDGKIAAVTKMAGPKGEKGEKGEQGEKGDQGVQGARGPAGVRGADGTKGAQGERGLQGAQGAQGVAGAKGEQGEKGKNGSAAQLYNSRNCAALPDGNHYIKPDGNGAFQVECMQGMIVMQKRTSSSVDFYRGWQDYKTGFGDAANTWLGNDKIHRITKSGGRLRILLQDGNGARAEAAYSGFSLAGEGDKYRLSASGYTGSAGDSLIPEHNGKMFTTYDNDNDVCSANCAKSYRGGWWYGCCHHSNLNGQFLGPGHHGSYANGVNWYHWKGYHHSMKTAYMLISN